MGERALQNRIMKLKEIEAQQKALEEQAEKIRQANTITAPSMHTPM